VLLNEKEANISSELEVEIAEKLVSNLVHSFSGFTNHQLIREGAKHEYIWTRVDPSMPPTLNESILKVGIWGINILIELSNLKMFSHFWFDSPTARLATYYARQEMPVFLYSFDHVSENFETDSKQGNSFWPNIRQF
jgi:hypothetical protein